MPDANTRFFREAARQATVPMLWLYADHDPFYSATTIRRYRAAFEEAGGRGAVLPLSRHWGKRAFFGAEALVLASRRGRLSAGAGPRHRTTGGESPGTLNGEARLTSASSPALKACFL
jgi:dienelactone hydrolase